MEDKTEKKSTNWMKGDRNMKRQKAEKHRNTERSEGEIRERERKRERERERERDRDRDRDRQTDRQTLKEAREA